MFTSLELTRQLRYPVPNSVEFVEPQIFLISTKYDSVHLVRQACQYGGYIHSDLLKYDNVYSAYSYVVYEHEPVTSGPLEDPNILVMKI